jgi:anti-sigma regulatory factor (Ser/Thr protein kinase)
VIVLEKLDIQARCAELRAISGTRGHALHVVGRLQSSLDRLGIERVGLVLTSGQRLDIGPAGAPAAPAAVSGAAPRPVAAASSAPGEENGHPSMGGRSLTTAALRGSAEITHRLEMNAGVPTYVASIPHRRDCLEAIATYTGIVLATHGPLRGPLSFFQLALYELIANILDHGRPLETPCELELGLRLESDVVAGWIQDRCQIFDPRSVSLPSLTQHLANRPRRGYGLHMVFNILDSLSHDFDGTGNRLAFWKEIPS